MRPTLESLEARFLLSGDLGDPTRHLITSATVLYGPVYSVAEDSTAAAAKHEDRGAAIVTSRTASSLETGDDGAARRDDPAVMAVYSLADALTPYPVQTYGSQPARSLSPPLSSVSGPSDFAPPTSPAVHIPGSVKTSQGSVDYHIPVGPNLAGLRLGVGQSSRSQSAALPTFDEVALYDGAGRKLAEMNSHWDLGRLASSSLFIAFENAPTGSELVLRISSLAAESLAQTFANYPALAGVGETLLNPSNADAGDDLPFILSIEQYERLSASRQGSGGLGFAFEFRSGASASDYEVSPGGMDASWSAGSQTSFDSDDTDPASTPANQPAPSIRNVLVPTGPLVSRGPAPLGGIFTSGVTERDPAPAIDRLDGVLSAYLDGLADETALLTHRERLEAGERALADVSGAERRDGRASAASATPGNLPLTALPMMAALDDDEAAAFLASLPAAPLESPIQSAIPIDVARLKQAEETPTEPGVASWASTAIGLTLGVTLTSGPSFPELLNSIRKLTPRRFRRTSGRFRASRAPR